jgi:hypothetical protein
MTKTSQSSMLSNTDVVTAKALFIKYRCSQIMKTSSTLQQLKYSIGGRHAGHKSSPVSTSKSSSNLALRMASQSGIQTFGVPPYERGE